ncbi:MAG: hypothetical protein KAJ88_02280 [Candidatus Aenigmarchaeota archaeon]|nr:hypothetical protein [Candidatus Aenigmarchaeota archaeon]
MIKISVKITNEKDCRILYTHSEAYRNEIHLQNAMDTFLRHFDLIIPHAEDIDNDDNKLIEVYDIKEDYLDYIAIKGINGEEIGIKATSLLEIDDLSLKKTATLKSGGPNFNTINIFDYGKEDFLDYKIIYQK